MAPEKGSARITERRRRRRSIARLEASRLNIAAGLLAVVLVGAPQLFGGVFSWSVSVIAAGACIAVAAAVWSTWGGGAPRHVEPVGFALLLALVWTAAQALPLPAGAIEALSPLSVEASRAIHGALGTPAPGWLAFSRDPGATIEEIVKGAAVLAAFIAAWLLAGSGRRSVVLMAVGASVIVMAVVALAHQGLGLESVFGVYTPRFAQRSLLAPLMNPNHLAGFLTMGVPVLLGIALHEERTPIRVLWLVGAAVCGATAILTLSRGGIGALIAGTILFGVLLRWRDRGEGSRGRAAWIAGALVVSAVLAAYVGFSAIAREVSDRDLHKLELTRDAGAFALEHPWLGVGRGAFAASFVRTDDEHSLQRMTHPENIAVQWASEWGVPFALLLAAVLAVALARALRGSRTPARIGAIAGVATIAMHDLVDYGLELVGIGIVAAALLGAALAPDEDTSPSTPRWRFLSMRFLAPITVLLTIAATAVLGPGLEARSPQALQDALERDLRRRDRAVFRATLVTAVTAHPAEPAFPLLAGSEAIAHRDPAAPRWLNRAMTLAPGWASPHIEAARWLLAERRVDQALLEIRQAAERDPERARALMCTVVRARPEPALVARATPRSRNRIEFLSYAATCLDAVSPVTIAIDAHLRRDAPTLVEPRLREARRHLARGDVSDTVRELRAAVRLRPDDGAAQTFLAESLLAAHRPTEAITALRAAEGQVDDIRPLVRLRARAETEANDTEAMRASIEELRGLASGDADSLAAALMLQGSLEAQLGNDHMSLRAYEAAYAVAPAVPALEQVAIAAERAGEAGKAYQSYSKLVELEPATPRFRAAIERLSRTP